MATGTLSWVRESARAGSIAGGTHGVRGLLSKAIAKRVKNWTFS
jgi:hypothetical protein